MAADRMAVIMAKLKKAKGMEASSEPSEEKEVDTGAEGLSAATESILSAVKSGDAEGLKSALKSFVSMCGHSKEEDDYEEGE